MYAVDDLGDAVDVTRAFLASLDVRSWLVLVLVVFFVAGLGFSAPPAPSSDPTTDEEFGAVWETATADVDADLEVDWAQIRTWALRGLAVAAGLWVGFSLVAALMEFVLLESLRRERVSLRRDGREHLGRALRLFGFRLALVALGIGVVAVPARSTLESVGGWANLSPGALAPVALLAFGYYLCYQQVNRLTTTFVAPVMVLEDRGVVSGWRRLWPTLAGEWREYLLYLVLVWICRLVVGVAVTFAAFLAVVVIGVPTAAVAVALVVLAGTTGYFPAAVVALGGLFVLAFVVTLARVPVESYFRYYALLVLGDTNPDLDLIARRRATVRGTRAGRPADADESRDSSSLDTHNGWRDDWTDSRERGADRPSSEWGYVDEESEDGSNGDDNGR